MIVSLDAARATAAIYVVFYHLSISRFWPNPVGLFFRFGQEAVIVFFLLSGFVIYANERTRALAPQRGYYWRRLRRIYPPMMIALAVSTLIFAIDDRLPGNFHLSQLLATFASLQDMSLFKPGVISDVYLGNEPLWSLSYEVAFYIVFPWVLRFQTRHPRYADDVIGLACCLAYASYLLVPNHFSLVGAYFLIWWSGAVAARSYLAGARNALAMRTTLAWLLALCAVAATALLFWPYAGVGMFPVLPLRHFASAAVILVLLFGPIGRALSSVVLRAPKIAAAVASISYGIYVLHFPIVIESKLSERPVGTVIALGLLVIAAWATERGADRLLPRAPKT